MKIPEGDYEHHGVSRGGIETEGDVKSSRFLRNSVDDDSPNPDGIGGLGYPAGCVAEHTPP